MKKLVIFLAILAVGCATSGKVVQEPPQNLNNTLYGLVKVRGVNTSCEEVFKGYEEAVRAVFRQARVPAPKEVGFSPLHGQTLCSGGNGAVLMVRAENVPFLDRTGGMAIVNLKISWAEISDQELMVAIATLKKNFKMGLVKTTPRKRRARK